MSGWSVGKMRVVPHTLPRILPVVTPAARILLMPQNYSTGSSTADTAFIEIGESL